MSYSFTPTQDFFSEDTRSQYVRGLNYTVRDGNEKLHALVAQWMTDGKVRLGTAAPSDTAGATVASHGQVTGTGTVS